MNDYTRPTRGGGARCARQRRAYEASRRMEPLAPCGCVRYPGVDRHHCNPEQFTESKARAAVAAAQHLASLGTPGIFDRTSCQAMHKIGHAELALDAFEYSHGEAA